LLHDFRQDSPRGPYSPELIGIPDAAVAGLKPPPGPMLELNLMREVLQQRRETDPVCHAEWSLLLCMPSAG
jgi:hypothetical protein